MVMGLLTPQLIAAYIVLSLIVAIVGRNRQIGFWGFFILSLIVTPIVTGVFMLICTPKRAKRHA